MHAAMSALSRTFSSRLAVLLGVDLARMLLAEEDTGTEAALTEAGQADRNRKVALDLVTTLLSQDRLDALTTLIADLCNEDAGFIDDVDVVDLLEIGKAFLGFFSLAPVLGAFDYAAEVALFYRWRPADIDELDWSEFLQYHAALRRMAAAKTGAE